MESTSARGETRSRLIAALPDEERRQTLSRMQRVELRAGRALFRADAPVPSLWFIEDGLAVISEIIDGCAPTGIAVVGAEGTVGLACFLQSESVPNQAVVQMDGTALTIQPDGLLGPALEASLRRYTLARGIELSRNFACYRCHSLPQRFARWLLTLFDRAGTTEVDFTQYTLAQLIGVRRQALNQVSRAFAAAGLIETARGHVTLLDRDGLEEQACDCYAVIRQAITQVVPAPTSGP